MNETVKKFLDEKKENISALGKAVELKKLGLNFLVESAKKKYSYNFSWMGRPIIAYPQDMIAMQEIIWEVQPDLIIETGIAHGGSIIYYASLMELIGKDGLVVGIDIDIRKHNRKLIEEHPMFKRIKMIEGSSICQDTINQISNIVLSKKRVMVCLDSNHAHEHVLEELKLYTPFVSAGSYCVVFDTIIEDMPADFDWGTRPWGKGNNPKTAVWEFLKNHNEFVVDKNVEDKLMITVAPDGFLKKIK